MSKFIKQPFEKFIRASDFEGPLGNIYTPYGEIGYFSPDVYPQRWTNDCFLRSPKIYAFALFEHDAVVVDAINEAYLETLQEVTYPNKNNHIRYGSRVNNGVGVSLDSSGAVVFYTGDPAWNPFSPGNMLITPNYVPSNPNAIVPIFASKFQGFDILVDIVYVNDFDNDGRVRQIAEEKLDLFLANLGFFDNINVNYYFDGSVMSGSIVSYYMTLFGGLDEFGLTVTDDLSELGDPDLLDSVDVKSKLKTFIRSRAEGHFNANLE